VCGGCFTYSKCDGDNMSKETTYNSSCPASTGSEGRQIRQIIGAMTNSEHDFSPWTSSLMPGFRSKWRRESDAAATVAAPALVHPPYATRIRDQIPGPPCETAVRADKTECRRVILSYLGAISWCWVHRCMVPVRLPEQQGAPVLGVVDLLGLCLVWCHVCACV
jgi:hypothetical protein